MHNKFYLNLNNLKSTQKILENFLKGFCCKRKFKATKGLNKIYLDFENSKLYFANFERHLPWRETSEGEQERHSSGGAVPVAPR